MPGRIGHLKQQCRAGAKSRLGAPAVLAAALALTACAGTPAAETGPVGSRVPTGAENFGFAGVGSLQDAVLRPSDTISVIVSGEEALSLPQVKVGQDGAIMVPGVGRVDVGGQTVSQVAQDISARLGESYLRYPRVAVNLLEAASRFVTVEGAVRDPGVFTYEPNTTLLGAVALAKGPSRVARKSQILLFRTIDGQPMAARFDLDMLRSGTLIDPVVLPQDRVVVGVSGGAQAWQDVLQALPVVGIFRPF